jgi:hypothetical protein
MRLVAEMAEFYFGNVVGLEAEPPDYGGAHNDTIKANQASWQALFSPLYTASLY